MMLENFSYLIDNQLAGSAMPGRWGDLDTDLAEARTHGISTVVTLTEAPLDPAALRRAGLASLHIPIRDFSPPSLAQFQQFVGAVSGHLAEGRGAVLVHCHAGIGRTGTMLAAWLIHQGMTPADAISRVRATRPGSIETQTQIEALYRWGAWLEDQRGDARDTAADD